MESQEQELEINIILRNIFRILRRRIWFIIIMTLGVTFIGAIAGVIIPVKQEYTSKISIAVNKTISDNDKVQNQNINDKLQHDNYDVMMYQNFINTYIEVVKSNIITQNMLDILKIKNVKLEDFEKDIKVEQSGEIVNISVKYKDKTKASTIVNTLAMLSMDKAKKFNPQYKFLIIDNPVKSYVPINSNVLMNIVIGFLLGLMGSLGIIYIIDFMDDTLTTEEDIKKYLNQPIIGLVSRNSTNGFKIDDIGLSIPEDYRTLRSNIQFSPGYKKTQTILVTSGNANEGKATISLNLAVAMAKSGQKTILIDCNPRKSKINELLGLPNKKGLSDLLSKQCLAADVINETNVSNLRVVTTGIESLNITELIASSEMKDFIELLKKQYDYIILYAPSMTSATDAQILAQYSDGCIFVVSSGESHRAPTVKSIELLTKVNTSFFGVLLNKIDPKQMWNIH